MTLQSTIDVTFVVAAYNTRETIAQTLTSALGQRNVTVEIVVADDRSTDGTADVVRGFSDPRIRLIEMPSNAGPGAARNAAIAQARGRWIAVLDSDDEIDPDRSARMINRAERLGAQIVVDNLRVCEMGTPPVTMFPHDFLEQRGVLTLADFIASNVIFKSTFNFGYMKPMFARELLETHDLRFDESLRIGEDYILLASALASGGTCAIDPEPGYVYHIRQGSISRVLKLDHVHAMIEADRRFVGRYKLDEVAAGAQRDRKRSLEDAADFLILVDSIKQKSLAGCLKVAVRNPWALRHLQMPIAKRIRQMLKPHSKAE